MLAPYQRQAYHGLDRDARSSGTAASSPTASVSGKTFVGLMLTEYYAVQAAQERPRSWRRRPAGRGVEAGDCSDRLPELSGEFTNVMVMAHTDLSQAGRRGAVEQLAQARRRRHHRRGAQLPEPRSQGRRGEGHEAVALVADARDLPGQDGLPADRDADQQHALRPRPPGRAVHRRRARRRVLRSRSGSTACARTSSSWRRPIFEAGARRRDDRARSTSPTSTTHARGPAVRVDHLIQNSRKYAVESAKLAGGDEVSFPRPRLPRVVPYDFGVAPPAAVR